MRWSFLNTGMACIGTDDVLSVMKQLHIFRYVGHIRSYSVNVMHQI